MRRTTIACAVSAALIGFCSTATHAQEAATGAGDEVSNLDRISVTGTRIINPNVVSPTPISTLTADDIKAVGAINIGDVMTKLPQLATTFTMGNSSSSIGTAGVQSQDLRNLGPNRTLTLVNGRRFVGATAGATDVDVNMIPAEWIERVEIITGGASAVYGADAVTGVVNFILKKDYQGAAFKAQYGSSDGGFDQRFLSATFGSNFADDRGNIAFSIEHSDQNALEFTDRFGSLQYRNVATPGNTTSSVLFPNAGLYATYEGGTFSLGDFDDPSQRYVFDRDGSVRLQRFDGAFDSNGNCADCDYVNLNRVRQLQPKFSRTTASGVASFDITPNHRLYWEGTFNHAHVKSYGQPAFGDYFLAADNAYITPQIAQVIGDHAETLDGETFYPGVIVSRFDTDAGRRGEDTYRNTARMVFGANGVFAEDWEYDAYVNYGVTREKRRNLANRINARFFAGMDAVIDPATGDTVCRAQLDPGAFNLGYFLNTSSPDGILPAGAADGCVPFSILGDGAISAGAANWFNATTFTSSRLTQFVAGGSVTNNNLFEVPGGAGSASLAAGLEYRRETSSQINDARDIAGETFLNAIPSFSGSYNVKEAFLEFAMPLLAERPFFKNLTLDAAVRASKYDTIGSTRAWKWGLNWALDDNVRLRGTMSSAVRAPNIGELFGGQAQNFFSLTDPCDVRSIPNAGDPALRAANCTALGIPADFVSQNSATVAGISGSNPDLKPETARTYTVGIVLTPQFAEGLSLNGDYWRIRLSDAVSGPSGQQIANQCVDTPSGVDNEYCANAQRDPDSHEIVFINSLLSNISLLETSGIDFGGAYAHALGAGRMTWNLNATRVIAFKTAPFQDDPQKTVESNGTFGFPEWKATLRTSYGIGNWNLDWSMRYFSEMLRVSNASYRSNPTQTTPIKAGSRVYSDVRASYGPKTAGWQVYGGVNNLFDRDAPVNVFDDTFGGALYDSLGRGYYVGVNYTF